MQEKEQQARGAEVPQPADVIRAIQERAPQPVRCQRILVPTDGSGQAFKAVLDAIHLAAATGAELTRRFYSACMGQAWRRAAPSG